MARSRLRRTARSPPTPIRRRRSISGHKVGIAALFRSLAAAVLSGLLLTAAPATAQPFTKLAGNPAVAQADILPAPEEPALNPPLIDPTKKTGHHIHRKRLGWGKGGAVGEVVGWAGTRSKKKGKRRMRVGS